MGGANGAQPTIHTAPSRDEIWAGRHQTGCHMYSTGATQFGTAQNTWNGKGQGHVDINASFVHSIQRREIMTFMHAAATVLFVFVSYQLSLDLVFINWFHYNPDQRILRNSCFVI